MPSVPRILRAESHGAISRPEQGIPVIATAWTQTAVEIAWEPAFGDRSLRTDWIRASDLPVPCRVL